jgi:choloylglycine hydrolase
MVAHSADSLPVRAVANSVYSEALEVLRNYRGFGGTRPVDRRAKRTRFLHAAELVRAFGTRDAAPAVSYAFDALDAVAQGNFTKWSIVYAPEESAVHFRTRTVRSIRSVSLKRFDFSSNTPVKILDVNADLRGDVSGQFVDYSRQKNREVIAASFAGTGMLRRFPGLTVDLIAAYPDACESMEEVRESSETGR